MKRTSSLVKFILVLIVTVIGLVASFVSFNFNSVGGNTWRYNGFIFAIDLGLDLKGGVYAVYESSENNPEDTRMNGTVSQLTDMLTSKGYTEATVVREGTSRIRVEVPDVDDPSEIFEIIGDPAELQFWLSSDSTLDASDTLIFSGDVVRNASAVIVNNEYAVSLQLNSEGASIFSSVTSDNVGSYIMIYETKDGEITGNPISVATINEAIPNGEATISGDFTYEEAQNLADRIMSGTFSVPLTLIETSIVDPTLGVNALAAGLIGGIIALVLIMVFMSVFYRMMGMVACVSMLIYMVLMLFLLAIFPLVQLSLPGIAGIILSLGMMIDGNVIIYERIKDEYRSGKSILAAYHAGFRKAVSAIVDGNVTTIIAAVMLLIFGTGTVSGFGMTLLIGLVLSLFSSLIVTRFLLKWTIAIWGDKDPALYHLRRRPGFDESEEIQYVPKPKKVKRAKAAAAKADSVPFDAVVNAEKAEEAGQSVGSDTDKPAEKKDIMDEDFDDIFGPIDGGDKQ